MIPEFSELVQRLEAERHDISYKTTREQPTRIVEVTRVQKRSADREKKMFHAGRYAAGARDKVAVAADEWLQKELAKNA